MKGTGSGRVTTLTRRAAAAVGARTPEETGVAIVAEIIALRSGRPAPHLRDTTGPIHG